MTSSTKLNAYARYIRRFASKVTTLEDLIEAEENCNRLAIQFRELNMEASADGMEALARSLRIRQTLDILQDEIRETIPALQEAGYYEAIDPIQLNIGLPRT